MFYHAALDRKKTRATPRDVDGVQLFPTVLSIYEQDKPCNRVQGSHQQSHLSISEPPTIPPCTPRGFRYSTSGRRRGGSLDG